MVIPTSDLANSVSRNGKKNTAWGVGIGVAGTLIVGGGILWLKCKSKISIDNNQHGNTKDLNEQKHQHKMEEAEQKHLHKMEEQHQKSEQKKEIIKYRKDQNRKVSTFDTNAKLEIKDEESYVETYDEVISGDEVDIKALRLVLRCFHIGEDCGLIGRTNIGKSSFVLYLVIAIALRSQKEGAILTPEWSLEQPMKILYFAFEQNKNHFKARYGRYLKDVPNLHIDVKTSADDFEAIRKKIVKMQSEIGGHRLLVVFDNITKMKSSHSNDKKAFFEWLDNYRIKCNNEGTPITYLKIFHTTGAYKDYMPIDATTNYGDKTDTYFTQDLVAFGMVKGGDGKLRYIKELKNKLEPDAEKRTLSVYRFADTQAPFYDYVGEAEECDILPSRSDLIRHSHGEVNDDAISVASHRGKSGRKREYTSELLLEMAEEKKAGFSWREIMNFHEIAYKTDDKEGINNKAKGIKESMIDHGISWK